MKTSESAYRLPADSKILIVEDEAIIAMDLESLLLEMGASQVVIAHSLKVASVILMREDSLTLALVDVELKDGSGLDLIGVLKSRSVPAILMTGHSDLKFSEVPVVTKPYDLHTLSAVTASVLQSVGG